MPSGPSGTAILEPPNSAKVTVPRVTGMVSEVTRPESVTRPPARAGLGVTVSWVRLGQAMATLPIRSDGEVNPAAAGGGTGGTAARRAGADDTASAGSGAPATSNAPPTTARCPHPAAFIDPRLRHAPA